MGAPQELDLSGLYQAVVEQTPLPHSVTAATRDPVTGAVLVMWTLPKKAVRKVAGSYQLVEALVSARVDVDVHGHPVLAEIRPR